MIAPISKAAADVKCKTLNTELSTEKMHGKCQLHDYFYSYLHMLWHFKKLEFLS